MPLTVDAWFVQGPSFVFLLRQFFLSTPREIGETAILDGMLSFQANWTNLVGALISLNTLEKYPMVLGLQFFGSSLSREALKRHLMMTMSAMMAAPILALFVAAQRFYIEGLTVGSVKR